MTLEEFKAAFAQAEAIPGFQGSNPNYEYYVPHGSGIVDATQLDTIYESLKDMVLVGYTNGGPVFNFPKAE